jgi:hypothetical protein
VSEPLTPEALYRPFEPKKVARYDLNHGPSLDAGGAWLESTPYAEDWVRATDYDALLAAYRAQESELGIGEYGVVRYAVEYLIKGETEWRRTMVQPLDNIMPQEEILWENPAMAATRMIAFCDFSRLLTPQELAEARAEEGK